METRQEDIFRKASTLIHSFTLWGGLSPKDRERLRLYWALLDYDERKHLTAWCLENKGKMPDFLRLN